MIHKLADCHSKNIGPNSTVWQFAVILDGAVIGSNCNINCHTFIEGKVKVGDNVTIKSGVFLWDGVEIEDDVFVGPNATFTNDKYPRSKQFPNVRPKTIIRKGVSIGAGAVIVAGIEIGRYAMIGAGAVVTKSIPDHALVIGNAAKIVGWVNDDGTKMTFENGCWKDNQGFNWVVKDNVLTKL